MKTTPLKIVKAQHIAGLTLRLLFSDGKEQVVDFGPFLKNSLHPEIQKFSKPQNFKRFTLKDGELMWGDFDLIFPIMDLYKNKIEDTQGGQQHRSSGKASFVG